MIVVGWNPEGHPPFATEASVTAGASSCSEHRELRKVGRVARGSWDAVPLPRWLDPGVTESLSIVKPTLGPEGPVGPGLLLVQHAKLSTCEGSRRKRLSGLL